MKYRNPTIPEGINTSKIHPLREFFVLSVGALLLIGLIALTLGYFGGQISRWMISVETERKWSESLLEELDVAESPQQLQDYLYKLGNRVETVMALPDGMHVNLIYRDEKTVNAFATLGGTILLYRGLLEKIPHENALVMLIAHEVSHIKKRDPIVSIGNAIGIQTAVSLLLSGSDISALQNVGVFTQFAFSRDMERDADRAALKALVDIYGHASGAGDLFRVIQSERREGGDSEPPAFLSTHPLDKSRIESIELIAREQGWQTDQPLSMLPEEFSEWLEGSDVE